MIHEGKNKMLQDDPDFQRRMTMHNTAKMAVPHRKLYDRKKDRHYSNRT